MKKPFSQYLFQVVYFCRYFNPALFGFVLILLVACQQTNPSAEIALKSGTNRIDSINNNGAIHFQSNGNPALRVLDQLTFFPETDGLLQIISYKDARQTGKTFYDCGGKIYEYTQQKQILIDAGEMQIGDIQLQTDSSKNYIYELKNPQVCQHLFGTMVNFSIAGRAKGQKHSTGFIDSLYVPKELNILSPTNNDSISRAKGMIIRWNPDTTNLKEVIVILDLVMDSPQKQKTSTERYITAADKGEYTIAASYFENVPANSRVTLKLIRGNCDVVVSDDLSTYSICGFSYVDRILFLRD